jgi:hypothetical protein
MFLNTYISITVNPIEAAIQFHVRNHDFCKNLITRIQHFKNSKNPKTNKIKFIQTKISKKLFYIFLVLLIMIKFFSRNISSLVFQPGRFN